ncbi:hypothetical protein G3480_03245 [Thiorhodococcus mannitoliphagus]|uniref:Glycosyltransferase RgtA/B/C/D-like domain-containing protein n=1 Tax=Thiorhodococcus mannitoliphagus TaxID=329406 RepID=A0A6P1DM54_9GAMM|nr:hypothetical protein [Thiorhodococcus mannitoliphagus]NEX19337.1 hypothetical protein [Thiorhodococcus mannitoliphagus]
MMLGGWLGLVFATLLPWVTGALWAQVLLRDRSAAGYLASIGYGYVIGVTGSAFLLQAAMALGLPLGLMAPSLVLVALLALGVRRLSGVTAKGAAQPQSGSKLAFSWQMVLFVGLLLWLCLRALDLTLEVYWRPVLAWDAWTTWLFRARAWAELGEFVPFVSLQDWLSDPANRAYTIDAWAYPDRVSVIALWSTLGYGAWEETAAKLPWLFCYVALGLGFYGQARIWGCSPLGSLVGVSGLLTLPILNTHVALAGYADLWMATSLGFASIAFFQWTRNGDRRQGALSLIMLVSALGLKHEGVVWALVFLPALVAAKISGRVLLGLILAVLLLGGALWFAGGISMNVPGLGGVVVGPELIELPYLGRFDLAYHDVWSSVLRHLFVFDTWHLLPYFVLISSLFALVLIIKGRGVHWLNVQMIFLATSLLALYALFFWTDAYRWVEKATSLNRLILHFVPSQLFWMTALWCWISANQLRPERLSDKPRGELIR